MFWTTFSSVILYLGPHITQIMADTLKSSTADFIKTNHIFEGKWAK